MVGAPGTTGPQSETPGTESGDVLGPELATQWAARLAPWEEHKASWTQAAEAAQQVEAAVGAGSGQLRALVDVCKGAWQGGLGSLCCQA